MMWVAVSIIASAGIWVGAGVYIMSLNHNIDVLERENSILQEDLGTYQSSAVYWKEKCERYRSANKALISVTTVEQQNKAVKATPLPKLVMKD